MRTIAAPGFEALRVALAEEITRLRSETASELRPLLVITPGDLARETTRRDLALRTEGTLGVRTISLEDWVREIAGPAIASTNGRRASPAAFHRLVSKILLDQRSSNAPSPPFSFARDSPGAARLFAASIGDLLQGRFDPDHLDAVVHDAPDPLQLELARVFREVHRHLVDGRRFDATREEAIAEAMLAKCAAPGGRDATSSAILLFGFHDVTAQQRALLDAASLRHDVTLFIPGPGGAADGAASPLLDWARERGPVDWFAAQTEPSVLSLESSMFSSPRIIESDQAHVELLTCADDAAQVRAMLRRIRAAIDSGERAFDEFAIVVSAEGPSAHLIRRIAASAGVPIEDRTGTPASRTFAGRRAILLARALSPRADEEALRSLAFYSRRSPQEPDEPVEEDPITRFVRARDGVEVTRWFREVHRAEFGEDVSPEVAEALDAIAEVHGATALRPRDFARELAATLSVVRERPPAADGSARVLLVKLHQARAMRRPVVFFCGFVAGALLPAPGSDPLLPDAVRAAMNDRFEHEGRRLAPKMSSSEESLLLLRFALESATERATILWSPRAHTGSTLRLPSGFLVDLASSRAGRSLDPGGTELLEFLALEPPVAALEAPVDRTDFEFALLSTAAWGEGPDVERLLRRGHGRFVPRALEASSERWRPAHLGSHDGVLASAAALSAVLDACRPNERAWSPTTLETTLSCPFAFLVLDVLDFKPPRLATDDYDPMDRGRIIHAALEHTLRSLSNEKALPLTPATLPRALLFLDESLRGAREDLDSAPAAARIVRRTTLDAMHRELSSLLAREAHRPADERTTPIRFEMSFASAAWPLPSGEFVALKGTIDRVDEARDGSIEIVDYKSGRLPREGAGVVQDAERTTVHLQLPLYAHAAETILGRTVSCARFVPTSAGARRRETRLGSDDLAATRVETSRLLERALACVQEGWFPSLPGSACCRRELAAACGPSAPARRRVKRGDPRLDAHLAILHAESDDVRDDGEESA